MTITREEFDSLVRRVSELENFITSAVNVQATSHQAEGRILQTVYDGFTERINARYAKESGS